MICCINLAAPAGLFKQGISHPAFYGNIVYKRTQIQKMSNKSYRPFN